MVKANELRIGNLVYYRKEDYKVILIAEDLIKIDIGYGAVQRFEKNPIFSPKINELNPIPLTEEWLEKLGCIKHDYYYAIHWGTNGVLIMKYMIPYNQWAMELGRGFTKPLEYVHQLQNLYFALTGNELEIK